MHDHNGLAAAIVIAALLVFLAWYGLLFATQHRFDVIYDRVGDIQRQLECSPSETLVADHEGNEYCVDTSERSTD